MIACNCLQTRPIRPPDSQVAAAGGDIAGGTGGLAGHGERCAGSAYLASERESASRPWSALKQQTRAALILPKEGLETGLILALFVVPIAWLARCTK